jgi:putative endonuclease
MNNIKFGDEGEKLAVKYLQEKGYEILETNWRSSHKEIDIIAKTETELIIIEVKTRSSNYFELPEEAVTLKKQNFMIEAAQKYIDLTNINLEVRFDIIAITQKNNQFEIKHIENAFVPNF